MLKIGHCPKWREQDRAIKVCSRYSTTTAGQKIKNQTDEQRTSQERLCDNKTSHQEHTIDLDLTYTSSKHGTSTEKIIRSFLHKETGHRSYWSRE